MPEPTDPAKVTVDAGGRRLVVSNLDKVIYPATETTKGEVLHYYARIAPVLLPHLAGRPVTRVRFPEGVEGLNFFEKNLPSGAPAWLPRVTLTHTSEPITYPMVTGLDALTYLANLASLEFHVPQWQIGADGLPAFPDRLVVDLDPGPERGCRSAQSSPCWQGSGFGPWGWTRSPSPAGPRACSCMPPSRAPTRRRTLRWSPGRWPRN